MEPVQVFQGKDDFLPGNRVFAGIQQDQMVRAYPKRVERLEPVSGDEHAPFPFRVIQPDREAGAFWDGFSYFRSGFICFHPRIMVHGPPRVKANSMLALDLLSGLSHTDPRIQALTSVMEGLFGSTGYIFRDKETPSALRKKAQAKENRDA